VSGDPQPVGAPCHWAGAWTGVDDCDVGLVCWDVDPDGDGTCRAYCTGSVAAPVCEHPDEVCEHHDEVQLCMPRCDPAAANACPAGETCRAQPGGFACEP
jgi:hypothetical protein